MNIVIDSNILFSALIKNSTTRKLLLEYEGYFLFPEFIFIACALAYPGSVIWSDDKALKKQTKIRIASTSEILKLNRNAY